MEIIIILFLVIILIVLINQGTNQSKQFDRLESEVHMLRQQMYRQEAASKEQQAVTKTPTAPAESKPILISSQPLPDKPAAREPVKEPVIELPKVEPVTPLPIVPEPPKPVPVHTVEETFTGMSDRLKTLPPPPIRPVAKKATSDMEKFIGENLISKIGIGILVIAIGFFVKYAIDNNWIGEAGRVGIGIVCGGILLTLAHRMRNNYKAFSSVLTGGGLAIFYFTIMLAYSQFHLISQTAAFIIMVGITAFAAILSLLYNKQELAIIALVGGFASPLLVSSGQNNYITLFTYLAILNAGILVISYYKGWRLLNFLSFVFTVLFFDLWLLYANLKSLPYSGGYAFMFAAVFYVLFFVTNIAHNIKENKQFIVSDFGILLANTFQFFLVGLYCMDAMGLSDKQGIFSAGLGLFNLIASYVFFRKQKIDTNILYLLIAITLSFVSLTAPLQLNGSHITLFWATETVLLYWLFTKSRIGLIRIVAVIIWGAMLISLLWDWANIYGFNNSSIHLPIIANKGCITTLFAAMATYALFIIRAKTDALIQASVVFPNKVALRIVALLLAYAAGSLELHYQFHYYYPQTLLYVQYLLLYTGLFALVASWVMQKAQSLQAPKWIPFVMFSVAVVFYLLAAACTYYTQQALFAQPGLNGQFTVHWLAAVAVALCIVRIIGMLKNRQVVLPNSITWLCCTIIVIFLSVEIHLLANALFISDATPLSEIKRVYIKTGLPILWGLCSFSFMWLGMRYKYRTLRIVSLSLFSVTLAKLFIFDIQNIPPAGKIAAFFCLGVLLLVVSFMYQRLKKIIIEDEKNNQ